MLHNKDRLELLRVRVARRAELKQTLETLEKHREELDKGLFALRIDMHNKQVDVDLLERFSLKNLYYDMTGKKEELLAKERSEARAAKEKHDGAAFQLNQTTRQIESCINELNSLSGSEAEYWQLLEESLIDTQGVDREYVLHAMTTRLETVISELETAHAAGMDAIGHAVDTLKIIDNVYSWNEGLAGAGWDVTMPGFLNGCQNKLNEFKKTVGSFCKKLQDLPLPEAVLADAEQIFVFNNDYLREVTSRLGADARLCDADAAVHAAANRIQAVMEQAEKTITELKQRLQTLK